MVRRARRDQGDGRRHGRAADDRRDHRAARAPRRRCTSITARTRASGSSRGGHALCRRRDDRGERRRLRLGPRDIPHRYTVGPNGCRMLFICTPGGFEDLVREMSVPAESRTLPPPSDEEPDLERSRGGRRGRTGRSCSPDSALVQTCRLGRLDGKGVPPLLPAAGRWGIGTTPRVRARAGRGPPASRRAAGGRERRRRGARAGHRSQAQRRSRHHHGDDPGQVAARGEGWADLPRHHRPPGAGPPGTPRRAVAAGADEQLPHARGLACSAPALPGAGRRRARRLRAEQVPEAARGRPRARELARRPGARVGAAGPRRRLHGAGRVGHARDAARPRLPLRVPLELGQPRRRARPAHPRLVRARGDPVPDGGDRAHGGRPQGRPPGAAAWSRPRATGDRADARGGHGPRSRTSTGTASSTRTASGSTFTRWPSCSMPPAACSSCRSS